MVPQSCHNGSVGISRSFDHNVVAVDVHIVGLYRDVIQRSRRKSLFGTGRCKANADGIVIVNGRFICCPVQGEDDLTVHWLDAVIDGKPHHASGAVPAHHAMAAIRIVVVCLESMSVSIRDQQNPFNGCAILTGTL